MAGIEAMKLKRSSNKTASQNRAANMLKVRHNNKKRTLAECLAEENSRSNISESTVNSNSNFNSNANSNSNSNFNSNSNSNSSYQTSTKSHRLRWSTQQASSTGCKSDSIICGLDCLIEGQQQFLDKLNVNSLFST